MQIVTARRAWPYCLALLLCSPFALASAAPARAAVLHPPALPPPVHRAPRLSAVPLPTEDRTVTPLAGPWKFQRLDAPTEAQAPALDDRGWQTVQVPHTWNTRADLHTSASAWYRTHFKAPLARRFGRIFVVFNGAATVADVYLNGQQLGTHRGAYTRFTLDATDRLHWGGDNLLAVRVSNDPAETQDCLPSGKGNQLYHVYGGLYRPVYLLQTSAFHIDPTDMGSSGVYITPQHVSAESADLQVRTLLRNDSGRPARVEVQHQLRSPQGAVAAEWNGSLSLAPHQAAPLSTSTAVRRPQLWSPAHPALYHLLTRVLVDGAVRDTLTEPTGFRFFRLAPDGFWLNGQLTLLRGVAKHQETEERLTAVHPEDLVQDFGDLRDLGVNYIRLPHYPHAPLEYDLADARGIVVWAENGHSNSAPWTQTGDTITREMVRQNYNHPSIFFWSAGNEAGGAASSEATNRYAAAIREEDTSRLVTYANNGGFTRGPALDFVATNMYPGWYGGKDSTFEAQALRNHEISETGAGGVISTHSDFDAATHHVDSYEPEEYQAQIAEERCRVLFGPNASQVPLFTWWAFRDFGDHKYKGWFNTKGLETVDRVRKDAFYLFQSFLRPDLPLVHITGARYFIRTGDPANGIKVYSNRPRLTLTLNGQPQPPKANGEYHQPSGNVVPNVFFWNLPLRTGRNDLRVDDGQGHTDRGTVYFYGMGGAPEVADPTAPVVKIQSNNLLNPAFLVNRPLQPGWPFFREMDGTADNRLTALPPDLQGCCWIATGRTSKAANRTDLTFQVAPGTPQLDVFLVYTDPAAGGLPSTTAATARTTAAALQSTTAATVPLTAPSPTAVAAPSTFAVTAPLTTADTVVLAASPAPIGNSPAAGGVVVRGAATRGAATRGAAAREVAAGGVTVRGLIAEGSVAERRIARGPAAEGPVAERRVVETPTVEGPAAWLAAGFTQTGVRLTWRDNSTRLVPASVLRRRCRAGETITIPGAGIDYLVLLRPAGSAAALTPTHSPQKPRH